MGFYTLKRNFQKKKKFRSIVEPVLSARPPPWALPSAAAAAVASPAVAATCAPTCSACPRAGLGCRSAHSDQFSA